MEWKEYKASEFCYIVTDGTHDSPKPKDEGHYLITSKHLLDHSIDFSKAYKISEEDYLKVITRSKVEQYDILFSMIGTIGNLYRVVNPIVDFAVKNMGIFKMGGDKLKSQWLYYWLKTKDSSAYINSTLAGSTQSYLTLKSLREFPIKYPGNDNATKILNILSSLDAKIENNNKINANLEAQAAALFKSWFVDFEPFRDGEFVESELGMIPKGWKVDLLGSLVKTTSGGTPSRKNEEFYSNGDFCWVKSKELCGGFVLDTEEKISENAIAKSSAKLLPEYSTLIAMYGATVGEYGIITKQMTCNQAICALLPNDNFPFTFLFMLAKNMKEQLMNMAVGSAQQNISQVIIKNIPITYDLNTIQKYHLIVKPLMVKIKNITEENHRLSSLRDTLLPKLMSGEIDLDNLSI